MSGSAREVVDALLAVLEAERAAIRSLDTAGVQRAAEDKQALANRLAAMTPAELTPVAQDLAVLRAELRRNGVLLAHARSCVDQAMDTLSPKQGGVRRGTLRARL